MSLEPVPPPIRSGHRDPAKFCDLAVRDQSGGAACRPAAPLCEALGHAYPLKAELVKNEFERYGPITHLPLRYTQALITQILQTAACNRHHSVDKQLCRWLLLCLDRLASNEISMTQELIANMLGLRRAP
jgi:hypothetical protein